MKWLKCFNAGRGSRAAVLNVVSFGLSCSLLAQVEVVNGDFESYVALPDASGQFDLVEAWIPGGMEAMPDFYHQQGANGGDLPQTPLAKVNPFRGRAIAGFVAYTDEANPRHEYVTGSFSEPLEVGQRYNMRFAISSGRVHDWVNAGLGVSGLGVAMSTTAPMQAGQAPLDLVPQFEIHEALYTRDWREISFVFTATEPFEWFTLGLFEGMPEVRREEPGTRTMAYYFVDDFVMEEVSNVLGAEHHGNRGERGSVVPPGVFVPNAFSPNGDDLNDLWQWSMPQPMQGQMSIVDRWGNEVWNGVMTDQEGWDGHKASGEPCELGTYAWRMVLEEEVEGQSVWKGWVTLVR